MKRDLETLEAAIEKADGYLLQQMWEPAWNVLEDLPEHLKSHPDILIRRIDVLTNSDLWEKALILAEGTVAVYPMRAEVWLRLARLQAKSGNVDAARMSARNSMELDSELQREVLEDAMLTAIW